jgi:hypothetical protein
MSKKISRTGIAEKDEGKKDEAHNPFLSKNTNRHKTRMHKTAITGQWPIPSTSGQVIEP